MRNRAENLCGARVGLPTEPTDQSALLSQFPAYQAVAVCCYHGATVMKPTQTRKTAKRTYQKHGLCLLKRAVKELGNRAIDRRTSAGKALLTWRRELIADLGGEQAISAQQRALVELAVRTRLFVESLDAWIMGQPSLVNARRRSVHPVVQQEVPGLLKELQKVRSQLPALDDAADTAAAEAEIMRVALSVNADLAAVPAMIAVHRKKRDQAEEAAIMRNTAERRIDQLEAQIKDVLRARRKREADKLKKALREAAEAFNRDLGEAYAKVQRSRRGPVPKNTGLRQRLPAARGIPQPGVQHRGRGRS